MGSANKILSRISKINFLGMRIKNIKNSVHSGNPIRTEFFQSSDLDNEYVNIYITGGSQGADYINENLPKALSKLTNIATIQHVELECGWIYLNPAEYNVILRILLICFDRL